MVRSARWLAPVPVVLLPLVAGGASLDGSKASLRKQQTSAENHRFTHLKNYPHLKRFVDAGLLVRLDGNANYELYEVAYPYARPEVDCWRPCRRDR